MIFCSRSFKWSTSLVGFIIPGFLWNSTIQWIRSQSQGYTRKIGTRRMKVGMFWIQWNHYTKEEATWKIETYLLGKLSRLSLTKLLIRTSSSFLLLNLGTRFFLGGKAVTTQVFGVGMQGRAQHGGPAAEVGVEVRWEVLQRQWSRDGGGDDE